MKKNIHLLKKINSLIWRQSGENAKKNIFLGSHGIAPTRDCTHFLKIRFVVAGGGFYSYYNHQCIKLDKERKIVRKKVKFYAYKKI